MFLLNRLWTNLTTTLKKQKQMHKKLKNATLIKLQRFERKIVKRDIRLQFFSLFQDAETIRKNANDAKNEAQKLHYEANNLRSRISSTESRFGKLEELANKDDELTESAKAKVGQAKTDSEDVQKQMQKALDSIKSIINELENMKEISIQDLDLLGNIGIIDLSLTVY